MTEARLHVAISQDGDLVRLTASGEVDAHTSTTLDGAVDQALALHRGQLVLVVDLADVPFMDSMGLRVLVRAQRAVTERDATMRIVDVRPAVARALEYAGLIEHLTVEEA